MLREKKTQKKHLKSQAISTLYDLEIYVKYYSAFTQIQETDKGN